MLTAKDAKDAKSAKSAKKKPGNSLGHTSLALLVSLAVQKHDFAIRLTTPLF